MGAENGPRLPPSPTARTPAKVRFRFPAFVWFFAGVFFGTAWTLAVTLSVRKAGKPVEFSPRGVEQDVTVPPASPDLTPESLVSASQGGRLPWFAPLEDRLARLGPPRESCFLPGAPPRRFDMVLVIAQGRSGSTSLLRLLNTLPCFNVRGENPALFDHLLGRSSFRAAADLLATKGGAWHMSKWTDTQLPAKPAWFNRFDTARTDALLRLLVVDALEHVPGKVTSGFKSITLFTPFESPYEVSRAFVDDWVKLFPRTALVFITRKDAAKSAWWRSTADGNETLARQAASFVTFKAEVDEGRYAREEFPGAAVATAWLDYEDVIKCRHGPGTPLAGLYELLGETWDSDRCSAVMEHTLEDYGIAMSELDYSGIQGHKGWMYGYRLIILPLPDEGKPIEFGPFHPMSVQRNVSGIIPDWTAQPFPAVPELILGVALHFPTIKAGRTRGAVPCRTWRSDVTLSAFAEVTMPPLLAPCNGTHPHFGYASVLLVNGTYMASRRFVLGSEGGSFKVALDLTVGTEVELCVLPDVRGTVGPTGLCQPALSLLSVIRAGGKG
ncbi:hypothetical protein DFJ74DRAFT_693183 [Hyaloraphidium curvatum]|nr:hypothetical protein DFJ74DRAFT_693183 [Hyaloraphidium curvatum]